MTDKFKTEVQKGDSERKSQTLRCMNDRTGQVDRCIEVVTENQDFQRKRTDKHGMGKRKEHPWDGLEL